MRLNPRLPLSILTLAGCFAVAGAQITYTVAPTADKKGLAITLEFTVKHPGTEVSIPNWAPGSYSLRDNYRSVTNLKAQTDSGGTVSVTQRSDKLNYWTLGAEVGQRVKVSYEVPTQASGEVIHYSGPSSYLYVARRKYEECRLKFDLPKNWKVAIGLDPIKEHVEYVADDYDVLADNPATIGIFRMDTYVQRGITHYIAYRGAAANDINEAYTKKACAFVSAMQQDFFKGAPYNRYVWHFAVNDAADGAGGLEHLSSTQISLASGVGPRAVSVISHEFFHLWNVKRIRSKVLGPFNYDVLPKTGALWWLEGVTDYYAHLLLPRYGWWGKDLLYKDVVDNVRGVRARQERFEVGPYESSYRVGEANNGRGNSQGYKVSYYNTGWLAGLCLDIEIMAQSNGKYSLDNVELDLWEQCKDDKPGFEEDEIRNLCIKYGGSSLGNFYDRTIMTAGELPVEAQLAKLGLTLAEGEITERDFGYEGRPNKEIKAVVVSTVRAAGQGAFKQNDEIVKIGNVNLEGASIRAIAQARSEAEAKAKAGDTLTYVVRRGGQLVTLNVKIGESKRRGWTITENANATKDQLRLRKLWMAKKRS